MLAALVTAASCSREGKEDPDDPMNDAFWLKKEKVFSPADLPHSDGEPDVSALYAELRRDRPENVVLEAGEQLLALSPRGDGSYQLHVWLFGNGDYVPMFTTDRELVPGMGYVTAWEAGEEDGS